MRIHKSGTALATIAFICCLLLPRLLIAQEPTDTVAGSVTFVSGKAAQDAEVVVTPVGSSNSASVNTDCEGRFEVHISRSLRYLVFARATDGATKRVIADRSETGRVEVQLVLEPAAQLPTVRVAARRSPSLGSRLSPSLGQSETDLDLVGGVVSPSDQGTIAAALALVPGAVVNADGSGFSVLGLGSEQNRVTFNGSLIETIALPQSTPIVTRINSSPTDVSKGGFSGALLTIEPREASNYVTTNLGISGQPRISGASDPLTRQLGRDESNVLVNFAHTGPIRWDRLAYTVSGQVGRRNTPVVSLLDLDPFLLEKLGITEDGVADLTQALQSAGVPGASSVDRRTSSTSEGSFMARLDFTPAKARSTSLTATGSLSKFDRLGIGPGTIANNAFASESRNHSVQLNDERTIHTAILNDFRAGYSAAYRDRQPYLELPGASVLLPSAQTAESVVPAAFGGAGYGSAFDRSMTLNLSNSTSWYSTDGTHLRKASIEMELERIHNEAGANTLGRYTYLDPSDIAADNPATFTRDIGSTLSRGNFSTLSASLGDTWDSQSDFSIQYGLRLDAFRAAPDFASASGVADQALLAPLQMAPKWTLGLSPRLGLQRTYTLGTAAPGSVARRILVSAGSGLFRSTGAEAVEGPLRRAGWTSSAASRLLCIGDAVPRPDWRAFAQSTQSIPMQCAGQSAAIANLSVTLVFLDRDFNPPYSWRTNLAASTGLGPIRVRAEGIVSLNRSQTDLRDLNQIDVLKFLLSNEGGRPVFVEPDAIDASGVLSTATNRIAPSYGAIWDVSSKALSVSRQLGLSLLSASPGIVSRRSWEISYVHSWVTDRRSGFEGTTAGDPFRFHSAPGLFQTSHQFGLRGFTVLGRSENLEITGYVRVNSGFRFTPLVASDINGDGAPNDRAWIFDPAGPASVNTGIKRLLSSAPSYVRSCLTKQVDHFAGAQSCAGPWSVSSTVNMVLHGDAVRLSSRSRLTLSFVNPVALADRLIHGDNTRGWGQTAFVDPYLYSVKGFDAATRQFAYTVNPSFGSTLSTRNVSRNPFHVSLALSLPIGPTRGEQRVAVDLTPGRSRQGPRTAEDFVNQHIMTMISFDPVARIGLGADSARYTAMQLQAVRSAIVARDSALRLIFQDAAKFAASLGHEATKAESAGLLSLRKAATDSAILTLIETARSIRAVLTVDQVDGLSSPAKAFLSRDDILHLRKLGFFVY